MGCTPNDNVCDNCAYSSDGKSGCVAPCTWDGQVIRIDMINHGSGYTVGSTTGTITSTATNSQGIIQGTGAEVTVHVTSGIVTEINLTAGGSDYQDAPTINIDEGTGGKGSLCWYGQRN